MEKHSKMTKSKTVVAIFYIFILVSLINAGDGDSFLDYNSPMEFESQKT